MNSCKFRFLGLVITTLFITGLIATPTEITTMKDASAVIKQSDLRTEKVGEVITASERSSALGIDGGSLKTKEGGVLKMSNSSVRINDRTGYVVQNEGRPDCGEGYVSDCSGDGDCCPESWIGDGFEDCEDQAYGCDLTCYDNDGGDCGGGTTTTTGGTACDEVVWSTIMTYDWYCTGSYGSASIDFCANGVADLSGNPGTWTSGNETTLVADGLCPLGGEFNNNLSFMFDNYATVYNWDTEGDDIYTPGTGYHDDMGYNGEGNWDGLSCINGGDCSVDTSTTTTTSGGGECPAGTVQDCVDDDCCPESWIGDGFEDCEDQAYGCDLTCYDNDGGDCGGGTTTTTTTTGGGDAYVSYTMTYDWYCTGSPGSATLNIYEDGTADLEGNTGTWMADGGEVALGDGLCPGDVFDNDLMFMFDNYTTVYMWDQADAGLCADGNGYHDDEGYNGQNIDGLTSVTYLSGECEDADPCDGQAGGDANGDGAVNVLDVVGIVNYILGSGTLGSNGATEAVIEVASNMLSVRGDGSIDGVQLTLSHGYDFNIDLVDVDQSNMEFAAKRSIDSYTTIVVVAKKDLTFIGRTTGEYDIISHTVAATDVDGLTGIELSTSSTSITEVVDFRLKPAYPNPFNPTTTLELAIPEAGYVSVKVFNLVGQEVATLVDGVMNANPSYTFQWNAGSLSSGVYLVRAEGAGQVTTQKLMLLK